MSKKIKNTVNHIDDILCIIANRLDMLIELNGGKVEKINSNFVPVNTDEEMDLDTNEGSQETEMNDQPVSTTPDLPEDLEEFVTQLPVCDPRSGHEFTIAKETIHLLEDLEGKLTFWMWVEHTLEEVTVSVKGKHIEATCGCTSSSISLPTEQELENGIKIQIALDPKYGISRHYSIKFVY